MDIDALYGPAKELSGAFWCPLKLNYIIYVVNNLLIIKQIAAYYI